MSESELLTARQFACYEGISRMEIYRRVQSGELQPAQRESKFLLDPVFLSVQGKARFARDRLPGAAASKPDAASPQAGKPPGALPLQPTFSFATVPEELQALAIPERLKPIVHRRLALVRDDLNGNYASLGFSSRKAYKEQKVQEAQARGERLTLSMVDRWRRNYKRQGVQGLIDKAPGPAPGTHLEKWQQAHIEYDWRANKFNKAQCLESVQRETTRRQNSAAWRTAKLYTWPTRGAVERFIDSFDAPVHAARQGADALRDCAGHMDRTYRDLRSLERVESDECKSNLLSYDPRWPVNRRGEPWIRRYWLLTFYDARSIYPLVWSLCEGSEYELRRGIALDDELSLFVRLVREFGVPAAICSDRGRFRGKTWGGEPYQQCIDREFAPANGIFQLVGRLARYPEGIRHNMPRVHNPRGARLERFHRFVADWFRGKAGWIGANTRERKMTQGDADADQHKRWCLGKLAPGEPSPLLTRDEVLAEVNKMMDAWRDHNSQGTDMCGLTPRAVFGQNTPASGFRRIPDDLLTAATAQHFPDRTIDTAGIVELPDHRRYYADGLLFIAGEQREVVRARDSYSYIAVLPDAKGEEPIIATLRTPVGTNDSENLTAQSEHLAHIRKVFSEVYPWRPPAPAKREKRGQKKAAAAPSPADDAKNCIGSVEWIAEGKPRAIAPPELPENFIDPEVEAGGTSEPSLYSLRPCTVERL